MLRHSVHLEEQTQEKANTGIHIKIWPELNSIICVKCKHSICPSLGKRLLANWFISEQLIFVTNLFPVVSLQYRKTAKYFYTKPGKQDTPGHVWTSSVWKNSWALASIASYLWYDLEEALWASPLFQCQWPLTAQYYIDTTNSGVDSNSIHVSIFTSCNFLIIGLCPSLVLREPDLKKYIKIHLVVVN